ncbi:MAG TPA: OmpA family protein [Marinobacterium sp.]|nr:OmpA family protein [Marinobacterium sp.]
MRNLSLYSVTLFVCLGLTSQLSVASRYVLTSSGVPVLTTTGKCITNANSNSTRLTPGCDPMNRVILLPDSSGKVGSVIVNKGDESQILDTAYAGAALGQTGQLASAPSSLGEVKSRFGRLLSSQPEAPLAFTVRFLPGSSTDLTPDSGKVIQEMLDALAKRDAPELRVTGHTDRVGALEANDRLSAQRARTVADLLIRAGVADELIEISGRGEREPAVLTADGVDEPLNRRVEINLR